MEPRRVPTSRLHFFSCWYECAPREKQAVGVATGWGWGIGAWCGSTTAGLQRQRVSREAGMGCLNTGRRRCVTSCSKPPPMGRWKSRAWMAGLPASISAELELSACLLPNPTCRGISERSAAVGMSEDKFGPGRVMVTLASAQKR